MLSALRAFPGLDAREGAPKGHEAANWTTLRDFTVTASDFVLGSEPDGLKSRRRSDAHSYCYSSSQVQGQQL